MLQDMGIGPGDRVRVAYLANANAENLFQEFFVLPEGLETDMPEDHAQMITLSNELLNAAKIPTDANIQIVCFEGVIILYKIPGTQMEGLEVALKSLGIASETLKQLVLQENDTDDILCGRHAGLR
jgi:hypothetical protein